jgi:hypothetical protein
MAAARRSPPNQARDLLGLLRDLVADKIAPRAPAARTAAQPRAGQERRTQLATITIPALQSATRPGVSPGGAMIMRAMIALVALGLAATAH